MSVMLEDPFFREMRLQVKSHLDTLTTLPDDNSERVEYLINTRTLGRDRVLAVTWLIYGVYVRLFYTLEPLESPLCFDELLSLVPRRIAEDVAYVSDFCTTRHDGYLPLLIPARERGWMMSVTASPTNSYVVSRRLELSDAETRDPVPIADYYHVAARSRIQVGLRAPTPRFQSDVDVSSGLGLPRVTGRSAQEECHYYATVRDLVISYFNRHPIRELPSRTLRCDYLAQTTNNPGKKVLAISWQDREVRTRLLYDIDPLRFRPDFDEMTRHVSRRIVSDFSRVLDFLTSGRDLLASQFGSLKPNRYWTLYPPRTPQNNGAYHVTRHLEMYSVETQLPLTITSYLTTFVEDITTTTNGISGMSVLLVDDAEPPSHRHDLNFTRKCTSCNKDGLTNFLRVEGQLFCLDCHVPKNCADCNEKNIAEFFTSERDGRHICTICFTKLKELKRGREKGFDFSGEPKQRVFGQLDPRQLKARRIANSVTHAKGLMLNSLASNKTELKKLMRTAGCRYVDEAVKRVNFSSSKPLQEVSSRVF